MQAAALPPYSKERNSGPSSSQVASRRARGRRSSAAEKSGTRNGLESRRWMTDCGTTRRSVPASCSASSASGSSSSSSSMPAEAIISRRSSLAASEMVASSASRESSDGVAGGGLGEDRGHAVEPLELVGLAGLGQLGLGLDPGALLADQERDDLELGPRRRRDRAALRARLDLADGPREHRDDALVVAVPAGVALAALGPVATGLALASSGQEAPFRTAASTSAAALPGVVPACVRYDVLPSSGRTRLGPPDAMRRLIGASPAVRRPVLAAMIPPPCSPCPGVRPGGCGGSGARRPGRAPSSRSERPSPPRRPAPPTLGTWPPAPEPRRTRAGAGVGWPASSTT